MDSKELLVTDVKKLVYKYLPLTSLKHIAFVSHADYELAWQIFYQTLLADSPLWEYLPAIHQKGSLDLYFEKILPPGCSFQHLSQFFTESYSISSKNLTGFIEGSLRFLTAYNATKHLQPQICLETLLADLDFVVQKLQGKPILDFLSNTQYSLSDRQILVSKYRYIETCLTTAVLFIFIHEHRWAVKVESTALLVTNKYLMCWLNGSNFIRLELLNSKKGLLAYLIHFVLGRNKALLNKEQVETLLSRLTDEDLCNYLPFEGTGSRRDLLLEVIKAKHPLSSQIGVKTTHRMIKENGNEPLLLFLLNHFGAETISLAIAKVLEPKRLIEILGYPSFMHQILSNLTLEQLCFMCRNLNLFSGLINSKSFLDFLNHLNILFPEKNHNSIETLASANQFPVQVNQPQIRMACGSSTLLVKISEVECFYPGEILQSKAAVFLTDSDKKKLSGESNSTASPYNFSDTGYRRPHPMEFSRIVSIKRPRDPNAWDPKDGPQVEEVFEEQEPEVQPAEKSNISNSTLTFIQQEKALISDQPLSEANIPTPTVHEPIKIPVLPKKQNFTNDQSGIQNLAHKPSPPTPPPLEGEGSKWKKWLLYGFLLLAGTGLLLSFLGLLEVSFALKACEAMINLLVECTPQAAALSIFLASAVLGIITLISRQIDHCIHHDTCCTEEDDSDAICSWNGICDFSEKNKQQSKPVLAAKTTAKLNPSIHQITYETKRSY